MPLVRAEWAIAGFGRDEINPFRQADQIFVQPTDDTQVGESFTLLVTVYDADGNPLALVARVLLVPPALLVREVIEQAFASDPGIGSAIRCDLLAVQQRDSACPDHAVAFLFFKGFHALQSYRIAHWLWQQDRRPLALFLQNRMSCEFAVDIHPAAVIGRGILLDHATGVVIGETAVVGDNVSMMQSVTLGGTGKESGDRHPKVADGVLIGAGAKILGNIRIGEGAKVSAGSVVLANVPPHTTVAGIPARVVGKPCSESPSLDMNHALASDMENLAPHAAQEQ